MLSTIGKRLRSPAAWALAMVLGAPMLAQAQQSGLFPLAPIRRERTPCPAEDPVYGMYRKEYFGYHPTCWRKFPAGWGCPSPEAPNVEQAFRTRKPDPFPPNPDMQGDTSEDEPDDAAPAMPGGNVPPVPPQDHSPFELDTKPSDSPPPRQGPAPAPRSAPPAANPPASPPPTSSPFELPPASGGPSSAAPKPAKPSAGAVTPTTNLPDVGELPPLIAPPNDGPLSSLPDPTSPVTASNFAPTSPVGHAPIEVMSNAAPGSFAPPEAVQAPKRPSLLGSLFGRKRR